MDLSLQTNSEYICTYARFKANQNNLEKREKRAHAAVFFAIAVGYVWLKRSISCMKSIRLARIGAPVHDKDTVLGL